jgi:proton-translocating NADH-quinone oxidoreductase chain N
LVSGDVRLVLPQACLAIGSVVVWVFGRLLRTRNEVLALLTSLLFASALGLLVPVFRLAQTGVLPTWGYLRPGGAFLRADPGGIMLAGIALGLGALVALYSGCYLSLDRRYVTFYPLLLWLVIGLVGMVLAADLFNLYLFCELMCVAAYVLVAFRRGDASAIEAGFKYLVMGSVGTVTMLLGISFVYRETGSILLIQAGVPGSWARVGIACLLVGLGIKSAIVPLHTWLPDAHGRAPSSVSAMLSGVVVPSGFFVLLKVGLGLGLPAYQLGTLLIAASLLSMTVGNGLALVQSYTKRLLAYSTIAQMGYVALSVGVGLRFGSSAAMQAGFFLLLAHAAMKALAFLCKGICHFYWGATTVEQLRGTAARLPLVAAAFAIALAGLAGVPPLAGFVGKWFVLIGTLQATHVLGYVGLSVFILNSLLALGYYLPVLGMLVARPVETPSDNAETLLDVSPWMGVPLAVLGGLVVAIGLYPEPWLNWSAQVGGYMSSLGR